MSKQSYLGMHRVKMYHLRRKTHFVIMRSVFDSPITIHTIYDLKGSRIGRSATPAEKAGGGVLKDNDIVENNVKMHLGPKREAFLKQLERDSMFLASLNIMDYSLLLGVHDRRMRPPPAVVSLGTEAASSSVDPLTLTGTSEMSMINGLDTPSRPSSAAKASRSNTPFRQNVSAQNVSAQNVSPVKSIDTATGTTNSIVIQRSSSSSFERRDSSINRPANLQTMLPPANQSSNNNSPIVTAKKLSTSGRVSFGDNDIMHSGIKASAVGGELQHNNDDDAGGDADGDEYDDEYEEDYEEDYEEEAEDDIDEGDSDLETEIRNEAKPSFELGKTAPSPVSAATAINPTCKENRVYSNSTTASIDSTHGSAEVVKEDAAGAMGSEGYRLSKVFRSSEAVLTLHSHNMHHSKHPEAAARATADEDSSLLVGVMQRMSLCCGSSVKVEPPGNKPKDVTTAATSKNIECQSPRATAADDAGDDSSKVLINDEEVELTFGPGIAFSHPWTSRADGGINSRGPQGRGNEIYFAGIIDILQEYNNHKYAETLFKVCSIIL
jgi:hypothetical protein